LKDSDKIRINNRKQWNIIEYVINTTTVTSQLVISDLQVKKHNGTYACDVFNVVKTSSVKQNTIVVVESESV